MRDRDFPRHAPHLHPNYQTRRKVSKIDNMKSKNNFLRQQCLLVDFKDENGIDKHAHVYILRNAQTTDAMIVWALKDQVEQNGCKLSAVADGLRCLYLAPGILEENCREMGIPIPHDKRGFLEYAGLDPVNKAELIALWENRKKTDKPGN